MTKKPIARKKSFPSRGPRPQISPAQARSPAQSGASYQQFDHTAARETTEMSYYGWHACRAIYRNRPEAIIRAYLTSELMGEWSFLMKFCVEKKLAYHVVTPSELEKITGSVHHEGISILASRNATLTQPNLAAQMQRAEKACYLYIDGVGNPHNIGALLRSAAHFGIAAIVGLKGEMPQLNPSGCRISEGGMEFAPLAFLDDRKEFFEAARKFGFKIYGTSSHKGTNLFATKLPPKAIIVLGAEIAGMQPVTAQECDALISIKGTGHVESLNVSVAGALLMAEFFRSWPK